MFNFILISFLLYKFKTFKIDVHFGIILLFKKFFFFFKPLHLYINCSYFQHFFSHCVTNVTISLHIQYLYDHLIAVVLVTYECMLFN